jgi:hypothetical protein
VPSDGPSRRWAHISAGIDDDRFGTLARMGWQISQGEVDEFLAERPLPCGCGVRQATFVVYASTGWGGHMLDVCAWCLLVVPGTVGDVWSTWTPEHGWDTPNDEAGAAYRAAFREAATQQRPRAALRDEDEGMAGWRQIMPGLVVNRPMASVTDLQAWALFMLTPELTATHAKQIAWDDWRAATSWHTLEVHGWITGGLPADVRDARTPRRRR